MTTFGYQAPKARKAHVCGYCAEEIPVGSTYHRWYFVDGPYFACMRVHRGCELVANDYYNEGGGDWYDRLVGPEPLHIMVDESPAKVRALLKPLPPDERGWCWEQLS